MALPYRPDKADLLGAPDGPGPSSRPGRPGHRRRRPHPRRRSDAAAARRRRRLLRPACPPPHRPRGPQRHELARLRAAPSRAIGTPIATAGRSSREEMRALTAETWQACTPCAGAIPTRSATRRQPLVPLHRGVQRMARGRAAGLGAGPPGRIEPGIGRDPTRPFPAFPEPLERGHTLPIVSASTRTLAKAPAPAGRTLQGPCLSPTSPLSINWG